MTSQQKKSKLKKKADRLLQEIGRELYDKCLVCGGQYSCLHHYYPKSVSYALRYNLKNCIPICVGCHMGVHQRNDPTIINTINDIMGFDWLEELKEAKKVEVRDTIEYIEGVIESLKLAS